MSLLTVSGSPHFHADSSVRKIMYGVLISLIPATLVSFYYFGLGAIIVTLTAVVSCLIFEFLIQKYMIKGPITIWDGSAIITGVLLAFNVPSNLPLWMVVVGSFVAIGMGKMTFGGLGKNPFNPALVGRVFMLISFPVEMTTWPKPEPLTTQIADVVTGPTALAFASFSPESIPSYQDMFIGNMAGSLGEISALALILGGIYMLVKRIITWHIPVSFIASVFVFTGIVWLVDPSANMDPVFHIITGGIMLGAIYMATDMVTSPMAPKGMLIFGVGCGVLTVVIRLWGAYPEGVSFAILIMNAFVPLIDRGFKPKRFGEEVKNG